MLAFARSIAKEKGRNVKIVERMITESLALSAEEALREGVIDLIATDLNDLLKKIDGREVRKFERDITVRTQDRRVVRVEENLKEEVLKILTNPTVAYLLLMLGFYGLFFELYNPGAVVPGVVGAICLLLGLYGLSIIDPESPYGELPRSIIVAVVLASAIFFTVAGRLGLKAQRKRKLTGAEAMLGEEGEAVSDFKKGRTAS